MTLHALKTCIHVGARTCTVNTAVCTINGLAITAAGQDIHIKLLDRVVSGDLILIGGVYSPLSVFVNHLANLVFDGVGLVGFKSRAAAFLLTLAACSLFCLLLFSLSLPSFYWLVFWGWGLWTGRV